MGSDRRGPAKVLAAVSLAGIAMVAAGLSSGCRSAMTARTLGPEQLTAARGDLSGPLPGSMGALYRLRVPSSGGLSFSVLALGADGRITISEPFGSALSVTAWSGSAPPEVFDLHEGCRFTAGTLAGVLGVSTLPLPEAVRLLGGRLPAVPSDRVEPSGDGRLRVVGVGWAALVTVAPDPWRVTEVVDGSAVDGSGWRIRLRDHRLTVPGWLKAWAADGRWAELELLRLQWNRVTALPALPELGPCGEAGEHRSAIAAPDPGAP